jgi:PadR family transcriptional regulator PadR
VEHFPHANDATLDVLEALMGPDDELYGLKIARLAGRKTGIVYPILAQLEEWGWVDSRWEREERDDRGPRRRLYRLSLDGLGAARELLLDRRSAIRQRTDRPATRRPRPLIPVFPGRHGGAKWMRW